jgi:hypothetical protein
VLAIIVKFKYDCQMDELNNLLAEKEHALAKAQATVSELQVQVDTLRKTLAMMKPTAYEQFLRSSEAKPSDSPELGSPNAKSVQSVEAKQVAATPIKNPKGSLSPAIIELMKDGKTRSIEETLNDVNLWLAVPSTLGSVRATLGNLKAQGHLVSASYGRYQIAGPKSEAPNDANGNSQSGGFRVQPVPGRGRNS